MLYLYALHLYYLKASYFEFILVLIITGSYLKSEQNKKAVFNFFNDVRPSCVCKKKLIQITFGV